MNVNDRQQEVSDSAKRPGKFYKGKLRSPLFLMMTDVTWSSLYWLNPDRDLAGVESEEERWEVLLDVQRKTWECKYRRNSWLSRLFGGLSVLSCSLGRSACLWFSRCPSP